MLSLDNLKIKIFSDGADRASMLEMAGQTRIKGLTTNPTLMNRAGIKDYKGFCIDILQVVKEKPISFEVFSDDFTEMERQAHEIASWGSNVYVKIPITNTQGEPSYPLINRLSNDGIKLNVTAIMTKQQVQGVLEKLSTDTPSYISVFAGRIADTGVDPVPVMIEVLDLMKSHSKSELIWASPRELLNIFQADAIGCHIITVTNDILNKLAFVGYDLRKYSLDTVKMFYKDAQAAGFSL